MLELVYTRDESKVNDSVRGFACAFDCGDKIGEEKHLISTILESVKNGISVDEIIAKFKKQGLGSEIFRKSLASRYILAGGIKT
jgi:hypothetical protein